jgi:hypothetical protein
MVVRPAADEPLRPIAPQAKWWIVGWVAFLLGAWELVFHSWFMGLSMVVGHRLNALIAALLVAIVVLAAFHLIQDYERRLAEAARALAEKNEALRALEAERDTRLVDLARDLAFAVANLNVLCDVAEGLPTPAVTVGVIEDLRAHARQLQPVVNSLLELKHDGQGLTTALPAILTDYERSRAAAAPSAPAPAME